LKNQHFVYIGAHAQFYYIYKNKLSDLFIERESYLYIMCNKK